MLIVAMGLNFTVIRFDELRRSPRHPGARAAVVFIPKPAVSWATLAGIGGFMFGGQFVSSSSPWRPACRSTSVLVQPRAAHLVWPLSCASM
jgi:hypothetical protein